MAEQMIRVFRKVWLTALATLVCGALLTYSLQLANVPNDGAAIGGILLALALVFTWVFLFARIWLQTDARIAQKGKRHR